MESQFIGEKQGDLFLLEMSEKKYFAYKTCIIQVQNTMVFGKVNDRAINVHI